MIHVDDEARQAARSLRRLADAIDHEIAKLAEKRDDYRRVADQVSGGTPPGQPVPKPAATKSAPAAKGAAQETLMVIFKAHPNEPLRVKQIMAEAETNGGIPTAEAAVRAALQRMIGNGKIMQPGVGQFQLAPPAPDLAPGILGGRLPWEKPVSTNGTAAEATVG